MNEQVPSKERDAFEAWAADKFSTHRHAFVPDRYLLDTTNLAWKAWQARADQAIRERAAHEPPVAPMSHDELTALCKRFVVEGYNGDYLEDDGFHLAREVEGLTLNRCGAAKPPPAEQIQRYELDSNDRGAWLGGDENGPFVRYDDHARIVANLRKAAARYEFFRKHIGQMCIHTAGDGLAVLVSVNTDLRSVDPVSLDRAIDSAIEREDSTATKPAECAHEFRSVSVNSGTKSVCYKCGASQGERPFTPMDREQLREKIAAGPDPEPEIGAGTLSIDWNEVGPVDAKECSGSGERDE